MDEACHSTAAASRFCKGLSEFEKTSAEPNLLSFHLNRTYLEKKKKTLGTANTPLRYTKTDFRKCLADRVSALRNSNGGYLLVHLCDKHEHDKSLNLSFFDEFADATLKKLICDGSLYSDSYERWMLCESEDETFQEYYNIIVLKVSKGKGVSTVEYNTRIGSDHEVEEPKFYELYSLLTRKSPESSKAVLRGLNLDKLYESRSIQLKAFPHQEKKYTDILDEEDIEGLVDCILEKLRLPEYIASISNIPTGGSYYVGVAEEKESRPVLTKGFKFDIKKKIILSDHLKNKLKTLLILKDIDSDFEKGKKLDDFISIELYKVKKSKNVILEVSIGFLPGVVFFDGGPVAYIVEGRGIEKILIEQWQSMFKSFFDCSLFHARS